MTSQKSEGLNFDSLQINGTKEVGETASPSDQK
jgi:hypothetical protein